MATADIEQMAPSSHVSMHAFVHAHAHPSLPSTEQLLLEGGDARIALGPDQTVNKYGCSPRPDPDMLALGSSTASAVSKAGFAAANNLRQKLLLATGGEPHAVTYAHELDRIRQELLDLCGLADLPDLNVIFAASGTDLHLIATQLAGGTEPRPTLVVMAGAEETGSGVPTAVAGRHFSSRSALGKSVMEGTPLIGGSAAEVAAVPIRLSDGTPRPAAAVDAEVESLVHRAVAMKQRVLLILVDVSKTGMIAPTPSCVSALRRQFPETVEVLVDACQFRIAPSTLRAYLAHGFMVALTGSKFLSGPTFAGALFIPAPAAQRLRERPLPRALSAYSARADWPSSWAAAEVLDNAPNFGLLLRWEAALEELRVFRSVPAEDIANFLQAFALAIRNRLATDPLFQPLPVPQLDRRPLIDAAGWDHISTIFPFLLYHPASDAGRMPLDREETMGVYRLLQADLTGCRDLDLTGFDHEIATLRCQLGQPVACGERDGVPVSALRLCASARLVVEATSQGNGNAVIESALWALDKAARLVLRGC